jgi:hypothetical protein
MMTPEEAEVVSLVYNRFMDNEERTWTNLDDNLEFFELLSDLELVREADVKRESHAHGVFRCMSDHEYQYCFAPFVLESVESILDLYDKTKELHVNNRYVLAYYLAMSEMKMLYSTEASSAV